jgi:hypothetical protein
MCFPAPLPGLLPPFNSAGTLPVGDYLPTAADFEQRFVRIAGSPTRERIYNGWKRLRTALVGARVDYAAQVLMNGSYTTSKLAPGDLDLVVAISLTAGEYTMLVETGEHPALELLRGHEAREIFDCDAFAILVLPEGHPHYAAVTLDLVQYWLKWFGTARDGSGKGRVWTTAGGFT